MAIVWTDTRGHVCVDATALAALTRIEAIAAVGSISERDYEAIRGLSWALHHGCAARPAPAVARGPKRWVRWVMRESGGYYAGGLFPTYELAARGANACDRILREGEPEPLS